MQKCIRHSMQECIKRSYSAHRFLEETRGTESLAFNSTGLTPGLVCTHVANELSISFIQKQMCRYIFLS